VVLVRLEQISPFPHDLLMGVVRQYSAAELVWCQEEPKNMGCWLYVQPRLLTALRHCHRPGAEPGASSASDSDADESGHSAAALHRGVRYVGRAAAASPATASFGIHQKETADILEAALVG
jgi:2-oxoglutarate dehydrogenase E1 component